jgi:hypothetical protein
MSHITTTPNNTSGSSLGNVHPSRRSTLEDVASSAEEVNANVNVNATEATPTEASSTKAKGSSPPPADANFPAEESLGKAPGIDMADFRAMFEAEYKRLHPDPKPKTGKAAAMEARAKRGVKRGCSPFEAMNVNITKKQRRESPGVDDSFDINMDTYGLEPISESDNDFTVISPVKPKSKSNARILQSMNTSKWAPAGEWTKRDSSGSSSTEPSVAGARRGPGRPTKDRSSGSSRSQDTTNDLFGSSSAESSVAGARRGPGRPSRDNSRGTALITRYLAPQHDVDNGEDIVLEPSTYVVNFGTHRGTPLGDMDDHWLSCTYYMANVRSAHPGFTEAASMELDRRLVLETRALRAEKFATIMSKKKFESSGRRQGRRTFYV